MYQPDNYHREFWLRGPVPGIPKELQPVAHALLQAQKEINLGIAAFPDEYLWNKPAGLASVGFHLQHIRGVLDRLFTYAEGKMLNDQQMDELKKEGTPYDNNDTLANLIDLLNAQLEITMKKLAAIDPGTLADKSFVGRDRIETTRAGLLFHAAEHTMRHTGQLLVTVKLSHLFSAEGVEVSR